MKQFPLFDEQIERAHNKCRKEHILAKLSDILAHEVFCPVQRSYVNDIRKFFTDDGLIAKPEVIKKFVQKVEAIYLRGGDVPLHIETVNSLFEKHNVFDYENFRKLKGRGENGWGGNPLMKELLKRVKVCPYCNCDMVYAIELESCGNGKPPLVKSAFDHFLPRWRYPFLALCLYNLIPSCYRCNSQFKQTNYKDAMGTFHPYLDDIDNSTFFMLDNLTEDVWKGRKDDSRVAISLCSRTKKEEWRVECYNRLFGIDVVYTQLYRKEAIGIIQKAKVCPPPYMEQVEKMFDSAGILNFDPHCFLYNVPGERADIDKHRLAKLTLDLEEMVKDGRVG